jgi:predicted DNA-binding protein (UPF0251 family)/predicted Fe-Mo cluster-binding NifX family protein
MVSTLPFCSRFGPENRLYDDIVNMTVDEYETIRLIDSIGLTQEQCANHMEVARTTVQAIYANARKKLAACIVDGKTLVIEGGEYRINECRKECCGRNRGHGRCTRQDTQEQERNMKTMRIAATYENGDVFQHFGHTEQFKVYDVEDGQVTAETIIDTNGNGHCALADVLKKHNVDMLLCGGIGHGAQQALAEAGITFYGGVSGSADKAVADFLAKSLVYDSDVHCEHHDEPHEGSCGDCGHSHDSPE